MTKELEQDTQKNTDKKQKIKLIITIVIIVLLLVFIAVMIAYISDFFIYKDTVKDGLLWTVSQREHGLFGIF
ncbi:hypothetical protein MALH04_00718 [Mycoplasma anatis]|uniref:hypothetical protein n=1 Tax=Mycoplasmopsis anatis TaxID=171279 RepID=UPI001C4DEF19|nr:hypothetical protein [Mycoplasmopsis anatis]MBW0594956.1 hypothetical protein [Mycoplasmopsis anatis]MBW0598551.1 hypothetical protein [Mycoplasmopsis anatis]MBW0599325.1 hypothetical protein [Mycoplasmopsis anatis]MBW0601521.1 hypothetical protein [Mycoplasmopsis anatis]